MCGIAGVWMKAGGTPSRDLLTHFSHSLHHRGPDAVGIRISGSVGLVNRRLKVIDLSDKANQPFEDGADILSFNGEIFNHVDLRRELSPFYEFTSHSDTEVLFRALQHWGPSVLDRLRGQFAFAFVDSRRGELILARDHVGI
ncbi:MAG TPA: asparagine synthetase B, partial [Alphaproteobacteria bacterium]|nr:asparagine synthetase B [Alphaproteobacteria bacterium]